MYRMVWWITRVCLIVVTLVSIIAWHFVPLDTILSLTTNQRCMIGVSTIYEYLVGQERRLN